MKANPNQKGFDNTKKETPKLLNNDRFPEKWIALKREILILLEISKVFVCDDVFLYIQEVTIENVSKSVANMIFKLFKNHSSMDSLLLQLQHDLSNIGETKGIDIMAYTAEEYYEARSLMDPTHNTYTRRISTRVVITHRMFNEAWETSFYQLKHTNIFPHNIRMFLYLPVLSNWYINRKDAVNEVTQ